MGDEWRTSEHPKDKALPHAPKRSFRSSFHSSPHRSEFTLRTDTGFRTPEEFGRLLVGRGSNGQPVHLAEVAEVRVGAENERNAARANGQQATSQAQWAAY